MSYKKEARLNIAQGFYNSFIKAYPASKYADEVKVMNEQMQTEFQNIKTKS